VLIDDKQRVPEIPEDDVDDSVMNWVLRHERTSFAVRVIAAAMGYAGVTLWLNAIRATAHLWFVWILIIVQFALYFSIFFAGYRRAVVCGLNKHISFLIFPVLTILGRVNDWELAIIPMTVIVMLIVSARTREVSDGARSILSGDSGTGDHDPSDDEDWTAPTPESMLSDQQWSAIDGEACRVTDFTPLGSSVQDGKVLAHDRSTPYASVTLECRKLPNPVIGFVTHKVDFANLWAAFEDRGVANDEEVIVIWSIRHYKSPYGGLKRVLPKMWVMVCRSGALELMVDPESSPELKGMARWEAEKPIAEWKPDVME